MSVCKQIAIIQVVNVHNAVKHCVHLRNVGKQGTGAITVVQIIVVVNCYTQFTFSLKFHTTVESKLEKD
jgi:hypothetical protein